MNMWRLALIMFLIVGSCQSVAAQGRSAENIKRERQDASRQIKETTLRLNENEQRLQRELNSLNLVEAEIGELNKVINRHQLAVDSIDLKMQQLNDSIDIINLRLSQMREKYATAVRKMQSNQGDMSTLSFIFSSETFTQAYRRMRYLRQFSQWRQKKSQEIKSLQDKLAERKQALSVMQLSKRQTIDKMMTGRDSLTAKSKTVETLVAGLQNQEKALKNLLEKKEREAEALDRELERVIEEQRIAEEKRLAEEKRKQEEAERKRIAEEQRRKREADSLEQVRLRQEAERQNKEAQKKKDEEKARADKKSSEVKQTPTIIAPPQRDKETKKTKLPSDKELTSAFASMRSRLPMPITSRYSVVRQFGVHQHPHLEHVKVRNSGIDFEVAANASVRAVYDGVVSAIFRQPGYNNIVMIRHGSYITIYTNLVNIVVCKGDIVKAQQQLGEVYADPADNNRSILHFEIRRETEKLNPAEWLNLK